MRGDLRITVLSNGNLEATRKQEITCKVKGRTTIIKLIEEGTYLTQEDIDKGRILVELDSSKLKDQKDQQEVAVEAAKAALIQAEEAYEIQKKQNESNNKAAELTVKFAKMDLDRYLGEAVSDRLASQTQVDFGRLAQDPDLGGAALQEKLKLESEIGLADEEVKRAEEKVKWTRRLNQKGYVTRNELDADTLALQRRQVALQQAKIALDLFLRYEFAKQAEKLYSDWQEAQRELQRVQARARSELAQKEADLKSKTSTYKLRVAQLKNTNEQIEHCTIRAQQVGLVIYASSTDWRGNARNIIAEGETVRERQAILRVPDTSSMSVKAKVHESVVKRVKPGQRALITVDALPDQRFEGQVKKVAILPDPTNWWLNPDLKEYSTEILIDGNHPNLKPGMSVKVEIIIDVLHDVLYVPVQAVHVQQDRQVCYLPGPDGPRPQPVKLGATNDTFVQVLDGLQEGQLVYLRAPSAPAGRQTTGATGFAGGKNKAKWSGKGRERTHRSASTSEKSAS